MSKKTLYRVSFISHNNIYEMYVRNVTSSNLFGFVELSEFVFGETTQVLVDPAEERLKTEFANVKRCYIPMHAVLRIDEVEKQGVAKITGISEKSGKVTQFPNPIYTPTGGSEK